MYNMKRLAFLFFMVLVCAVFVSDVLAIKKVAVYTSGEMDSSIKKIIGAKMITAITNSGDFAAVERTSDFLAAMSKERDYQTSGEVKNSQIAKLGQKFGVKYVVVADINEAFDEIFITARLINVETGLVESSYDYNGVADSMQELINASQNVISGLFKNIANVSTESKKRALFSSTGKINNHDYVDLGLPSGLKWATCNVGSKTPTESGDFYPWGYTSPRREEDRDNRYTIGENWNDISGNVEHDVARSKWRSPWRLPTRYEFQELINNCNWQWLEGLGYKIIGPNGNFIFIPAARYAHQGGAGVAGDYWSSSPDNASSGEGAYRLFFNNEELGVFSVKRYMPLTIRPVCQ